MPVTLPVQLSVAVGDVTEAEHSAVISGRYSTIATGASLSKTVTVNVHGELPITFTAVAVTVVVPMGKTEPDAGE